MPAVGQVDLLLALHDDAQFFKNLLQLFHEHFMAETKAILEAGAEMVHGTWFNASLSVGWSPDTFEEYFLPMIGEHIALVHDYGAIYHYYDDGKLIKILPWLAEADVEVVSTCGPPPMGDFDIIEAKRLAGDKLCFMCEMAKSTPNFWARASYSEKSPSRAQS